MLTSGIFTLPEAAQLLGISPQRLRVWVCGKHGAKGRPLIRTTLPRVDHRIALSFVNLIEAKFIETFSSAGVSVLAMRYMAEEAERFLSNPHPFATDWIFKTDGRKIFVEASEKANDCLYDLKGHNYAIPQVFAREFKQDLHFSASGIADAWFPRKDFAPQVRVSPRVSFGKPSLLRSGVPTETLFNAYISDGNDASSVANWFSVPEQDVSEAVAFETSLRIKN